MHLLVSIIISLYCADVYRSLIQTTTSRSQHPLQRNPAVQKDQWLLLQEVEYK